MFRYRVIANDTGYDFLMSFPHVRVILATRGTCMWMITFDCEYSKSDVQGIPGCWEPLFLGTVQE